MKKLFLYALLLVSAAVNAADFWPASCLKPISIGQTINGEISTTNDCYWWDSDPNGKWYTDVYTFSGTAGQQIAITMNGVGSFDPDLTLYLGNSGANTDKIVYDDNGGGGLNARIPPNSGYITLASTGTYMIWASALSTNTGGSYTLTLLSDSSSGGSGATTNVIEFYHAGLDHYFITAGVAEAAAIDSGSAGPGWARTGGTFKSGGSASVCRFYGSQSPGPNSHFYTVDPAECAGLKQLQASTPATQKRWNFESLDFVSTPPTNGSCPGGTVPVYRAYNNGFARGVDSNHRISSNQTGVQQTVARGWIYEGVVMCAPPSTGTGSDGTTSGNSPDQAKFIAARGYPHLFTLSFITEVISGANIVPLTPPRRVETWVYNDANVTAALFDNGFFISQETLGAHTSLKSTNLKPEKFTLGMTEAQVIAVAGQPTCIDSVRMAGMSMRFLRYAATADSPVAAVGLIDGTLVSVSAGFLFSDQPNPGTNLCSAPL